MEAASRQRAVQGHAGPQHTHHARLQQAAPSSGNHLGRSLSCPRAHRLARRRATPSPTSSSTTSTTIPAPTASIAAPPAAGTPTGKPPPSPRPSSYPAPGSPEKAGAAPPRAAFSPPHTVIDFVQSGVRGGQPRNAAIAPARARCSRGPRMHGRATTLPLPSLTERPAPIPLPLVATLPPLSPHHRAPSRTSHRPASPTPHGSPGDRSPSPIVASVRWRGAPSDDPAAAAGPRASARSRPPRAPAVRRRRSRGPSR